MNRNVFLKFSLACLLFVCCKIDSLHSLSLEKSIQISATDVKKIHVDSFQCNNAATTTTTTSTKAPWPPLSPGLKSLNSDIQFTFRINNDLSAIYDMYWIDYNGNYVRYATIQPGEYITQQTFVTHPWVLRSQVDGSLIWFKPNVPPFTTSDAASIPFSKITSTLDDITNFT